MLSPKIMVGEAMFLIHRKNCNRNERTELKLDRIYGIYGMKELKE